MVSNFQLFMWEDLLDHEYPSHTEFLHTPGPHTKTASQFGHVCRTLSMYQALETVIGKWIDPPLGPCGNAYVRRDTSHQGCAVAAAGFGGL